MDIDASYFQGRDLKIKVIKGGKQFASAHTLVAKRSEDDQEGNLVEFHKIISAEKGTQWIWWRIKG